MGVVVAVAEADDPVGHHRFRSLIGTFQSNYQYSLPVTLVFTIQSI